MHSIDTAVIIDWTVFMGMHAEDEAVRIASKNFFCDLFTSESVTMPLAEVGECDDVVWRFSRTEQDAYYPFMDRLHTDMAIQRTSYPENALEIAREISKKDNNLTLQHLLLIAHAKSIGAKVLSWNKRLASITNAVVSQPESSSKEKRFPGELESLYQESLALRVKI